MHPICHFAYSSTIYCWDEENRLTSYSKSLKRARFSYDASGERYYKNSGSSVMSVNNGVWQMMTIYATPTLYASPYLVATNKGYTKHYYAESERIASKIGGGLQDLHAVCDELYTDNTSAGSAHVLPRPYAELPALDFEAKRDSSKMHLKRLADCVEGEMGEIKENILVVLNQYAAGAQASPHSEDECYWYHPDHLGSASWVSDKAGKGIQHLYYLPWGEELDNQRATDYASRYTFSGKERDMETGYGYFGARYYNPALSVWLSVDPLSDKYPGSSPYVYCADNPVKLVDPDGREYIIDGEDSKSIKAAFAQLQASTHLQLKMDKNGKVRIIGGEASTDYDTKLKEAINSSTISVTIHTTSDDTYEGYIIPGGSHFGTHYDPKTKTAKTEQVVNPYLLGAMDLSCGRVIGTSMAHEALEAYFCGTKAIEHETNIQKAMQGNPTYYLWEQAHNLAPEQPDYTGIYGWTPTGWYGLANCLYLYNTKIRENPAMPIQFLVKNDFWHMKVPSQLK